MLSFIYPKKSLLNYSRLEIRQSNSWQLDSKPKHSKNYS